MKFKTYISTTLHDYLNEHRSSKNIWYHGTPDAREIEKAGGFTHRTKTVDYAIDPKSLVKWQNDLSNSRENDRILYNKLLAEHDKYIKKFTYQNPIFLSNKYSVAKTYADPKRAYDYQNCVEKVYQVETNCEKIVSIVATGDRFRFLAIDKVKQGFINSGVAEDEIDKLISMFNYYVSDNRGVKTDVIAAIGNWLGFDAIDVMGVLDSYHGGTVQSTVRIVLDSKNVKIV